MGHGCHMCGCPNGCECSEIEDQRRSREILKELHDLLGRSAYLVEDLAGLRRKTRAHENEICYLKGKLTYEKKKREESLAEGSVLIERFREVQRAHKDEDEKVQRLVKEYERLNP